MLKDDGSRHEGGDTPAENDRNPEEPFHAVVPERLATS
jgi:hypothetical protein